MVSQDRRIVAILADDVATEAENFAKCSEGGPSDLQDCFCKIRPGLGSAMRSVVVFRKPQVTATDPRQVFHLEIPAKPSCEYPRNHLASSNGKGARIVHQQVQRA